MCRLGLCGKCGVFLSFEAETFTFSEKLLRRLGIHLEKKILKETDPAIPAERNK